jgi:lysozyme family protein
LDNGNNMPFGAILKRVEGVDGFGYQGKGIFSPYLWSGTNFYTKGKYLSDHIFDPNAVSRAIGVVPLLRRMHELGKISLTLPDERESPRQ